MPSCYVSICFIAWTCDFVWRVWYALYCVVPLIPGLFESPLLLVCVMHCWCGKEWMHILHKSKGRLPFQECTGRNPPDKDLTYNHKNGHKWCMIVLLKEPRNAPGPPAGAHPRCYPLHISALHVWTYTKAPASALGDDLYETQVFTTNLPPQQKPLQTCTFYW